MIRMDEKQLLDRISELKNAQNRLGVIEKEYEYVKNKKTNLRKKLLDHYFPGCHVDLDSEIRENLNQLRIELANVRGE